VAPLWAGLTALVNQATSLPIGFFLPELYQNPRVMRDITQGDNKPPGSNLGYTAGPGWDACTGLGVPIGSALLQASAIRGKRRRGGTRRSTHAPATPHVREVLFVCSAKS
jgi:hypothetical protein